MITQWQLGQRTRKKERITNTWNLTQLACQSRKPYTIGMPMVNGLHDWHASGLIVDWQS
jgi:hypothetical protein